MPGEREIVEAAATALESLDDDCVGFHNRTAWYQNQLRGKVEAVIAAIRPLIEADERERCAKVAENFRSGNPIPTVYAAIASAIRALSQPKQPLPERGE